MTLAATYNRSHKQGVLYLVNSDFSLLGELGAGDKKTKERTGAALSLRMLSFSTKKTCRAAGQRLGVDNTKRIQLEFSVPFGASEQKHENLVAATSSSTQLHLRSLSPERFLSNANKLKPLMSSSNTYTTRSEYNRIIGMALAQNEGIRESPAMEAEAKQNLQFFEALLDSVRSGLDAASINEQKEEIA